MYNHQKFWKQVFNFTLKFPLNNLFLGANSESMKALATRRS